MNLEDLGGKVVPILYGKDEATRAAALKEAVEVHLPFWLSRFEATLAKNAHGVFVGDSLTIADFRVWSLCWKAPFPTSLLCATGKCVPTHGGVHPRPGTRFSEGIPSHSCQRRQGQRASKRCSLPCQARVSNMRRFFGPCCLFLTQCCRPKHIPKLKLTYFNFGGRAEAIRLAFVVGGVPFEDERLSFAEVAAKKAAGAFKYGDPSVY